MQCVIVMGVCGCGKTTVGKELAKTMKCDFFDADDYHTNEAVSKMSDGIPLTDEDRHGWLNKLRDVIRKRTSENQSLVLSCSALKQCYREQLKTSLTLFIYLKGDKEIINERLSQRQNHYMPTTLLDSQLATLEEPNEQNENVITIDIQKSVDEIIKETIMNDKFK